MRLPTRGCLRFIDVLGESDVYVGRAHRDRRGRCLASSRWANPFKLHNCTNLHECLSKFESHLNGSPQLLAAFSELSGRRLVCHCAPSSACHADIIISIFARELLTEPLVECSVLIGVHFEPEQFLEQALGLSHPIRGALLL